MKNSTKLVGIVTGGSEGIGYAIACYLATKGYQLLLISRNQQKLEKAQKSMISLYPNIEYQPLIAAVDVADNEKITKIIEDFTSQYGPVNLLCNSAGYVKRGTSDLSYDELMQMINTNLVGTFNSIRAVSPSMKANKCGRIINIVSRSGVVGRKQLGGYAASKFGVMGLNEALYKELAHYGIYVTALCPNLVDTNMTADVNIERSEMIHVDDIVKTVDYLLHLSPSVAVKEIIMQCRYKLISDE